MAELQMGMVESKFADIIWQYAPVTSSQLVKLGETELGWKPMYHFDTGIKMTIQWYLDNKPWWENIISGEYRNYYKKMYENR